MGLLAEGEAWLRSMRAGQTVSIVYRRGVSSATIPAVQARTQSTTDQGEIFLDATHADWLIERSELDLGAGEIEPQAGDQIDFVMGHATENFLVCTLGSDPAWKWHGRDGATFRIHSIRA